MIKKIFTFFIFFVSFSIFSQTNLNHIIKPRFLFSAQNYNTDKNTEIVILENDTLFNIKSNYIDLSYLNDSLYTKNLIRIYKVMVFMFSKENSKVVYEINQWNTPIVIYFDKQIPKDVVKDFKAFYNQISSLEQLKISFTSNIKLANYFIKTTSKSINAYGEDYEFDSEFERENSFLTGATYMLNSDDNNKYYSATLTINIERGKTNMAILKQLKQLFFMSLGNFYNGYGINDSSLLSNEYMSSETISKFDFDILKLHYHTIYPQKINSATFDNLMILSKIQP